MRAIAEITCFATNRSHINRSVFRPNMNPVKTSLMATITAILTAIVLITPGKAIAQPDARKATTTEREVRLSQLPEGFSADELPLIEGLNEARGTWAFEGETFDGEEATPLNGSLQIIGNPKSGILPTWKMAWSWPADSSTHAIHYTIMASPKPAGFDLTLFRFGPVKNRDKGNDRSKVQPTIFKGEWELDNRVIKWTESDLPTRIRGQSEKADSSHPKQTFEMVIDADGKISIRNSKHSPEGQFVTCRALERTGDAPAPTVTLSGAHNFKTIARISDQRIIPSLPPNATEISLLSERGGHFARYKITEADLMKFLDDLWEAKQDSSAHKRDMMGGEGEPASRESMVRDFKATGWKPLDKAITYYSPSKRTGAMTTYYYDAEAGIAYHSAGYW